MEPESIGVVNEIPQPAENGLFSQGEATVKAVISHENFTKHAHFEVCESSGNIAFSLSSRPFRRFKLACGTCVDLDTGKVDIPDGLPLDEASREFWRTLTLTGKAVIPA